MTNTNIGSVSSGTGLAIAPDGRVFVLQQTGQVRIVENGIISATPALDLAAIDTALHTSGEHGLVGIALDPNFASNGHVYLQYTRSYPGGDYANRIARFTVTPGTNTIDQTTLQILLDLEPTNTGGHVGGGMVFGPDGKLYTTIGDRRIPASAQDLSNTWGSVLRLNPDGTFAGGNLIPTGNACANQAQKECAIFVQGLRNPFGIAVQSTSGLIFINDAGEQLIEEINALAIAGVTPPTAGPSGGAGANYGWSQCEGPCAPNDPSKVDPLYSYSSANGNPGGNCAITGGAFYNPASPSLGASFIGDYLFLDYCSGRLTALDFTGPSPVTTELIQLPGFGPVALAIDSLGGIYYLDTRNNQLGYLFNANVPEPKTWIMLGLALSLLYAKHRTRR